jgi:tRNA(Ile)-lysidine synthase
VIDVVRDTIRRHAMLAGGETVLVAVSGGADSVALLHVLRILAPELRLTLSVVHLDHGLRPDSALDAAFVESLARGWGLPVTVEHIVVSPGGSLEARARDARYAALRRQAARVGAHRVALGHTADDQAETVLMRILQGAGPRGLAGIPPVRDGYIRPLLDTRRSDIVAELRRAGLAWREDPTNRDPRFLRNRLRHDLLPRLAAAVEPEIVPALTRLAGRARELVEALAAAAAAEVPAPSPESPQQIVLSRRRLAGLPPAVGVEVLRLAAVRLGHPGLMRGWAHRELGRVLADPPPRSVSLGDLRLESAADRVRVWRGVAPGPLPARLLARPGVTTIPEIGRAIEARCFDRRAGYVPPRHADRVAFDADAVPYPLAVRSRRPGDRFRPFGSPGGRRLKSTLIDARVPRWERDRLPLVVAGDAVLWIAGLRRSALAPVTDGTRRVLELSLTALANAGRAE